MLKKFLTLLFVLTATATFAQEKAFPTILPQPSSIKHGNANIKFDFTTETRIVYKLEDGNAKYAADELNRVGLHAQHPPGGFPDGGESFHQNIVQRFAPGQPVFEFRSLGLQSLLGKIGIFRFQRQDLVHRGLELFDFPVRPGTEQFCKKSH